MAQCLPRVVVEVNAVAHKQLGVSTLPDTYLVDRSGKIVERYHGARNWRTPCRARPNSCTPMTREPR